MSIARRLGWLEKRMAPPAVCPACAAKQFIYLSWRDGEPEPEVPLCAACGKPPRHVTRIHLIPDPPVIDHEAFRPPAPGVPA